MLGIYQLIVDVISQRHTPNTRYEHEGYQILASHCQT